MPWSQATQEEYKRKRNGKELETTLTDVEWQLIEPLLPAPLRTDSSGPRGYDAGKRIKGRKRQLAVDVEGLPIMVQVGAAKDGFFGSIQDRDSAPGPEAPTKPSLSDLRDPRAAGEGSNGREAVGRWCLCGTETGWEIKGTRALRTARGRDQTQGKDPKSPSLGLHRAISSLGGRPGEPVFKWHDPQFRYQLE